MPTIEVSRKDLDKLVGKKLKQEEVEDLLMYAKCEYDGGTADIIKADCKDTNRPDLWCAEGIARQIRGALGKDTGLPHYTIYKSKFLVRVDSQLKTIRPRTACAVIKGIKITDDVLKQIIQMQEKITGTFGRNRKEAAIGVYDFDKITWPVRYAAYEPTKLKFKPLESNREMTLRQILSSHPKGREFAHLLEDKKKFPIFIDADKNVLSMPPIINSDYSGKVTDKTRNLFIEVSGFEDKFIHPALNSIVAALADRGGKIYEVRVKYGLREQQFCPIFKPKRASLKVDNFNRLAGLDLSAREIKKLLEKARLDAKIYNNAITVDYPAYRQDIMHEVDIIEDVIVAYGYNNLEPEVPKFAVLGEEIPLESFSRRIREFLVGFGAQEIATFTLTNKDKLFNKMNINPQKCIEIANPVSQNWCVLRNWLIPSIMDFLSNNTTREYPQTIFEVGEVVIPNLKAETCSDTLKRLAFVTSHQDITFTKGKQVLQSLMDGLELKFTVEELDHKSFVPGRAGYIKVNNKIIGMIGEIHPQVLQNWRLENTVIAFELDLNEIMTLV
jgi:phenylalanyl-tRNA synthetase beta chain